MWGIEVKYSTGTPELRFISSGQAQSVTLVMIILLTLLLQRSVSNIEVQWESDHARMPTFPVS